MYLPIRALGNAIGQSAIEWDSNHNISYIKANNNEVETWSGSNVVIVNGKDVVKIDETSNNVCAYTSEGRTYLPLRAVLESLGFKVDWYASTSTVAITDPSVYATPAPTPTPSPAPTTKPDKSKEFTDTNGRVWESQEAYVASQRVDPNGTSNYGEKKPTYKGNTDGEKSPEKHWSWDEATNGWIPRKHSVTDPEWRDFLLNEWDRVH